jgi:serine/threonine protein kinase
MIGKTISHYRIVDRLGAGGMGEVYRAEDTKLGRDVAIKVLPSALASDPARLARLQHEAKVLATLNHHNIASIYGLEDSGSTCALVMELVEGSTLAERIAMGPLPLDEALPIVRQILAALSAAHRSRIIHRDLKPANIMIRTDGCVKVLDFGLARLVPTSPLVIGDNTVTQSTTIPGQVLGTPAYMSPEHALCGSIECASDLFSLGIILYEMIVGRHPWPHAAPADTLHAIIHDAASPLPASIKGADVLQVILDKALRKDPADRYGSAEDILDDFARILLPGEEGSSSVAIGQPSLAVLPFVFLSPIAEKESLSLGFADALITSLGNLEDFLVPPTSAILKYPAGSDPSAVSRELQVRHVLQGNIQTLGPRWRVTIQMYDARARKTVLTNKLDFNLEDIFEIQDQICQRVADSLSGRFRPGTAKTRDRYSRDPDAYDEYLRGLKYSYSDTPETMESALQHLSQAVKIDPGFALAHAALARVLVDKHLMFDPHRGVGERAERHAQRALELDSELPEGHLARAYILWSQMKNYQGREAIAALLKAQSRHPNLDGVHGRLGLICCHYGRIAEGLEAFDKARRMNPDNMWTHWAGLAHLWLGDFNRAVPEYEEWLRKSPGSKYALWLRPQPALLSGDLKNAKKYLTEALEAAPEEPLFITLQGILHALRGEIEAALDCVRRARESPDSFGHDYQLGCIYSILGETRRGLAWINRAVETGFPCWTFFKADPTLAKLRALPEFQAQIEELREQSSTVPTTKL